MAAFCQPNTPINTFHLQILVTFGPYVHVISTITERPLKMLTALYYPAVPPYNIYVFWPAPGC